jgi:hypothetical protein
MNVQLQGKKGIVMSSNAPERHRENFLWTASWPLFLVFYVFSVGRSLLVGDVFPQLLLGLFAYTVVQTWMSTSFKTASLRIMALLALIAIGCWDRIPMAIFFVVFGILVLLSTSGVRAVISKIRGKKVQWSLSFPSACYIWVWILVPVAAFICALLLRYILMTKFSTTLSSGLVVYSIRPVIIRQVIVLGWVGAFIFTITSGLVLLFHKFREGSRHDV